MQAPTTLHFIAHHPATRRTTVRAAGWATALILLAACDGRTPTVLSPQSQLVEPLEMAYRQFADPSMAALEQSCDTAPTLAQALDGWADAVDEAGLQSRFPRETVAAKRRAAAIRTLCPSTPTEVDAPERRAATGTDRARNADPRPAITTDTLDAYARGLDEELALMRASGSHFVSLSKRSEDGRRVAAAAGLSPSEYQELRQAVHSVLYELMMHARYAGPAGQARLAGLEPHKREHAREVLARDPYASLSAVERDAVQARLDALQTRYDRYMDMAAIAD
ncbi:MAG TPA: hypothetical protein VLZ76_02205 [Lysobacter sp.]|nr:hypothetical protein [Lysobacter sp.]